MQRTLPSELKSLLYAARQAKYLIAGHLSRESQTVYSVLCVLPHVQICPTQKAQF